MPLYKVTLEGWLSEIIYVRAECEDTAIDNAIEHVLDEFMPSVDVDEVSFEDLDDIDEDEVLS